MVVGVDAVRDREGIGMAEPGRCASDAGGVALASTVAEMAFQIEVGGSRNSRSSASSSRRSA